MKRFNKLVISLFAFAAVAMSLMPMAQAAAATGGAASDSKMISLINQERGRAGLKTLSADSSLRAGALKHSQDMSAKNFFSHTSPTNGTFAQRAKASGARVSAENLALNGSVEGAHAGLMSSSAHKANIMNSSYTRVGIGIVYSPKKGGYYITQWFGR